MIKVTRYYVENPKGATATIFVPYDCDNNCPFCINKKEYADTSKFDLNKILDSIVTMDKISPECDFVLTGGEPFTFSKMDILWAILETIKHCKGHHDLYINTTMPVRTTEDYTAMIKTLNRYRGVITGLNVSRHSKFNVQVFQDVRHDVAMLKTIEMYCGVRINCVLYKDAIDETTALQIFKEIYKDFKIQFRKDYVSTSYEDLMTVDQQFVKLRNLYDARRFQTSLTFGINRTSWEVCPGVSYHVTLPYSKIPTDDGDILIDVIINQEGKIMDDWNDFGQELDLEAYEQREIFTKGI